MRGREDVAADNAGMDLVAKATSWGIKIWNVAKLDNVISRCLDTPQLLTTSKASSNASTNVPTQRSLQRLLQSEKLHGISERDPSQKRHDFRYFSKGSKFVLVEDLKQELATICAHEYIVPKGKDDQPGKGSWPVAYCHPHARGPFHPFDERERRRWERQQQAEKEHAKKAEENARLLNARAMRIMKRKAAEASLQASMQAPKQTDLRRSVSLSNIRREQIGEGLGLEFDAENPESANASGYLQSGFAYVAASGNSVGITSTVGTTSAGYTSRMGQLPLALAGRLKHEVVTSRKARVSVTTTATEDAEPTKGVMGPPRNIPDRHPQLRKSKSTNTLKLPKRDEGSKPGYCESCRVKFEDFKAHISGKKHRKFAEDDANFFQLDCVLAHVQRRTKQEVWEEQQKLAQRRKLYCGRIASHSTDQPDHEQDYDVESDRRLYHDSEDGTEDVTRVASSDELSFEHISASTVYDVEDD
ncbi:hypothetical protein AX16_006997 [Volvariella volvacea WC 439]|nr:hypothetical protein AX16_006997 [Volvariella volvacea WC 439]